MKLLDPVRVLEFEAGTCVAQTRHEKVEALAKKVFHHKQGDYSMLSKDYFIVKKTDQENFIKSIEETHQKLLALVNSKPTMTVKEFKDFNEENDKTDEFFNRNIIAFYASGDEEISETLQVMQMKHQELFSPMYQDQNYFNFIQSLIAEDESDEIVKKRILKGFEKSGLGLCENDKKELLELFKESSVLSIEFKGNISKDEKAWKYVLEDDVKSELNDNDLTYFKDGILEYNQNNFSDIAEKSNSKKLRKIIFDASNSIASDSSVNSNKEVVKKIIRNKQRIAEILGHKDYTQLQLDDRMVNTSQQVIDFMNSLKEVIYPVAEKEHQEFTDFVKQKFNIDEIDFEDNAFYQAVYKKFLFDYKLDEEREYFKFSHALEETFSLIHRMFDITFEKTDHFEMPFDNMETYKVYKNGEYKGIMLTDFYNRLGKNGGAWVLPLEEPYAHDTGIISISANFDENKEGLSAYDLVVLLHEFGHLVHHFSSETKYGSLSGTSGMAKDAVEIPSQMLEKYGNEENFMQAIAARANKVIPVSIIEKMKNLDKFNIGTHYCNQISYSLFDMILHRDGAENVSQLYFDISKKVKPWKINENSNFPNVFSHIFASGYSAGYYSYIWAEVYSIDAYMFIKENEKENAGAFKKFLEVGSSKNALDSYIEFRGKDADINNLLKFYQIVA